jgi:hypothetical protein
VRCSNSTFNQSKEREEAIPAVSHMAVAEQLEESDPAFLPETRASSSISRGLERSHSKLSSIRSSSIRNWRVRLSSKLSRSVSHVSSVLSMTNSWRSSLVYAVSISSDRMSKTREVPLTHSEFRSWNEIVDESRLAAATSQYPNHEASSLGSRPCCEFFEKDIQKRTCVTFVDSLRCTSLHDFR